MPESPEAAMEKQKVSAVRLATRLAIRDMAYEWVLTVCMVLALAAVIAPLLILLGLREGVVGNLLDRLRHDPLSRLVTPRFPLGATPDKLWWQALNQRAQHVIASPTTRLLLDIDGLRDTSGRAPRVNVLPTSASDPLMVRHGLALSRSNPRSAIISARLSEQLGLGAGAMLPVRLSRSLAQGTETVPLPLEIAGVLPLSVTADVKFWLPADLFDSIYRWRRGEAAPQLGLRAGAQGLPAEFDGILTLLSRVPSDAEFRTMLARRMAFSQLPTRVGNLGWDHPPDRELRLWEPINSPVYEQDFQTLEARHFELGYDVETLAYIEPFDISLELPGMARTELKLTIPPEAERLCIESGEQNAAAKARARARIAVGEAAAIDADVQGVMSFPSAAGPELSIPVITQKAPWLPPGYAAICPALAGKVNAARDRPAMFDSERFEFVPTDQDIRFFRAYAASIDELGSLVAFIREEGRRTGVRALAEPVSKLSEVENIRRLAGYLDRLYFLVAAVSGVSGFFAIMANVYSGVERKRHDLAYLQVLGLSHLFLFLQVLLKSLFLMCGAVLIAVAGYLAFGYLADTWFAGMLHGEVRSITRLTAAQAGGLLAAIFVVTLAATAFAGLAVTRVDPAEHVRE